MILSLDILKRLYLGSKNYLVKMQLQIDQKKYKKESLNLNLYLI